jgi:long-chain fatty acid transport protein
VENILPQRLSVGGYHEWSNGRYFTFGATWIDFSEFGTGDVEIEGNTVAEPDAIFKDLWILSVGAGFPVNAQTTYRFGAVYLSQAVNDHKRTLALRLDRVIGIGAGLQRVFSSGVLDCNINLYLLGDAPVDTGPAPLRGRVSGESQHPYALAIDLAWHW